MKCHSKTKTGFSLIEALAALVILVIISGSVLAVINRCVMAAADSTVQIQALEVARENMEKLLAAEALSETVDYGISKKYPQIKWQTTVETFFDPVTSRMWLKGICSAEYEDSKGQMQTMDLTCWLAELSREELLKIVEQKAKEMANIPADSGFDSDKGDYQQDQGQDEGEGDKPQDDKKEDDQQQEEPEEESEPPLPGLPDGWENWGFAEAMQWLKENGYW